MKNREPITLQGLKDENLRMCNEAVHLLLADAENQSKAVHALVDGVKELFERVGALDAAMGLVGKNMLLIDKELERLSRKVFGDN